MEKIIYIICCFTLFYGCKVSEKNQESITDNNPLLPGYFADPTIKKFGDKYYIYSTTDGVKLASGEPTVWVSDDMVNWYNYELDIDLPQGLTNCWAPDVVKGKFGLYYYYMGNCQFGCNIYGYGNYGAMAHGDGSVDMPFKTVPSIELWHLVTITFDGMKENVYVDGRLDNQMPINLFVKTGKIRIGASGLPSENYTGYLSDIRLYNKCLSKAEIETI